MLFKYRGSEEFTFFDNKESNMDISLQISNSNNLTSFEKNQLQTAYRKFAGSYVQNSGSVNTAGIINLKRMWKSYNNTLLGICSDNGDYEIVQSGKDVVIRGNDQSQQWQNIGVGEIYSKSGKWFIDVFWTDTQNSTTQEKGRPHLCTIEICTGSNCTVTKKIIEGKKLSYGTWQ